MAITSGFCNVAKLGYMRGRNGAADAYKLALYTDSASLNSATTRYLTANEVSGTGYSAGGVTLGSYANSLSAVKSAIQDWADAVWTASTFSTKGALLYNNSSASKEGIGVFDFGSVKEVSAGTFTVQFPAYAAGSATIEFGA